VFSHNPEFDNMFYEHGNFAPSADNEVSELNKQTKNQKE